MSVTNALRPTLRASSLSLSRYSLPLTRALSTSPKTVSLAFDVQRPAKAVKETEGQSLVVLHGLFGSKQNWRSLSKAFAAKLGMPVYALDLRNHGISPHAAPHSYAAMAEDVAAFLKAEGLHEGVNLMGHSMGGKTAMALALTKHLNAPLRSLISIDMAPAEGKISPEFAGYIQGMLEIQHAGVSSRSEADKIMQKWEPCDGTLCTKALVPYNVGVRQFLLTNLATDSTPDGTKWGFRIPLRLFEEEIDSVGHFPYSPPPPVRETSPEWRGPTLFLKGDKSRYINKHNLPICQAYFPNMELESLPTGHWVHSEKPAETLEIVSRFLGKVGNSD